MEDASTSVAIPMFFLVFHLSPQLLVMLLVIVMISLLVGGSVLLNQASTSAGTTQYDFTSDTNSDGLALTENTLLNATIIGATGGVARIIGEAKVRGR